MIFFTLEWNWERLCPSSSAWFVMRLEFFIRSKGMLQLEGLLHRMLEFMALIVHIEYTPTLQLKIKYKAGTLTSQVVLKCTTVHFYAIVLPNSLLGKNSRLNKILIHGFSHLTPKKLSLSSQKLPQTETHSISLDEKR